MDLETDLIIKKVKVLYFIVNGILLLLKNYQSDLYLEVKLQQKKKMKKRRRKRRENRGAKCEGQFTNGAI